MGRPGLMLLALGLVAGACGVGTAETSRPPVTTVVRGGTMQLTSSAFADSSTIPALYTCQGDDTNPPLAVGGVPDSALSLVLIVDDPDAYPDAPQVVWEHWVMWNIPPDATSIEAGTVPTGAVQGTNSWGRTNYGGPCPPIGTHRYFFKLYALDTTLALATSSIKADVETAMQGHILAEAVLMGRYGG